MIETLRVPGFECSVVSLGLKGQPESGDLYTIRETANGVLIGVIDGLGHGVEAATAAQLAVSTIEAHCEESIINIARACHEKLRNTRGVVMALAEVNRNDEIITWLGIGNVQGILVHMDPRVTPEYETIVLRSGVVGYNFPSPYASVFPITTNDLLILSTDGIRDDYPQSVPSDVRYAEEVLSRLTQSQIANLSKGKPVEQSTVAAHKFAVSHNIDLHFVAGGKESYAPRNLADYISSHYLKGSDDALVLVAKYTGKGEPC